MKSKLIISILTLFLALSAAAQGDLLLTGGKVFDGERMHDGWHVLVAGNMIRYAGPERPALESNARVVDFTGNTLLPGLIEGHSHLFLHPYDETPWNDQVLKESFAERTVRAVKHAEATLLAGFTTVRDLGTEGGAYLDVGLKAAIEKRITHGPRMIVAGRAIVATGSYGPKGFAPHVSVPLGAQPVDGPQIARVVREQIGYGADVVKVYADYRWGPFGQAMPTFSVDEIREMVEVAGSSGRQVVAHAATAEGMRRAVLAGVRTIEHGDGGTPEIFRMMRDSNVCLCPTLAAGDAIMQYRGWQKGTEPDPERIVQKKKSFSQALNAGVAICAGGDAGVFTHGDNARELEMMVEYGMPAIDVLRSATSVNAAYFGLENLGRIREGYLADLIIVPGDPSKEIRALSDVLFVMKDGMVYRDAFEEQ